MTHRYFGKKGADVKKNRLVQLLPLEAKSDVNGKADGVPA